MESSIFLLPDHIINQIAAGEVIENPASVVKELVENSLDAGATKVQIEIEAGGMLLIRVSDNGIGMNRSDLERCLMRHATSKIKNFDDLMKINTMGFRGEALASVASISRMKIASSKDGDSNVIYSEGGCILKFEEVSRVEGTLVEVRSLFYNVPVRKNFQKSTAASISEIIKIVNQLALANPYVSFILVSQEKKIIDVKSEKKLSFKDLLERRVKEILGEKILFENLNWLEFKDGPLQIKGFIGSPSFCKKNRSLQYLLVNRRVVFSNLISMAIKEGYGTRIDEGDYPIYILHVDAENRFIDVNVHPQKKYVRLTQEQFIRQKIQRAISFCFQEEIKKVSFEKPLSFYEEKNISSFKISELNLYN